MRIGRFVFAMILGVHFSSVALAKLFECSMKKVIPGPDEPDTIFTVNVPEEDDVIALEPIGEMAGRNLFAAFSGTNAATEFRMSIYEIKNSEYQYLAGTALLPEGSWLSIGVDRDHFVKLACAKK